MFRNESLMAALTISPPGAEALVSVTGPPVSEIENCLTVCVLPFSLMFPLISWLITNHEFLIQGLEL